MSWSKQKRHRVVDDYENYDLDEMEDEAENFLDSIYADPQNSRVVVRFPTMVKYLVLEPEIAKQFVVELNKTLEILEQ